MKLATKAQFKFIELIPLSILKKLLIVSYYRQLSPSKAMANTTGFNLMIFTLSSFFSMTENRYNSADINWFRSHTRN